MLIMAVRLRRPARQATHVTQRAPRSSLQMSPARRWAGRSEKEDDVNNGSRLGAMPALVVDDATEALSFYTEVFEAVEQSRNQGPEGTIPRATVAIGTPLW